MAQHATLEGVTIARSNASFLSLSISAKRLWGVLRWVALGAIILVTPAFLPRIWGWEFGWVGGGFGGWSMANEGGIMPLSVTYQQRQASYKVGDFVVFDYQGGSDETQNGRSVKCVTSVNADGSYAVAGLNSHNSVAPYNAHPESIYGKVMFHRSLMPVAYWRWLSMEWQLNATEIHKRWASVIAYPVRAFSSKGRTTNVVNLRFSPSVFTSWSGERLAVENESGVEVWENGKLVLSSSLLFLNWSDDALVLRDPHRPIQWKVDVDGGKVVKTIAPPVPVGGRISAVVARGEGLSVQTIHAPYSLTAPFTFSTHKGEKYRVEKVLALPSDEVLDGKPSVIFRVFPPLDIEDGETEIALVR